ncbi:MAG: cupin domain-containing protein [Xanthomonadaceae bacterium]|nr:cupin domain-containing protein [Xanthomonadaceae bacterium]
MSENIFSSFPVPAADEWIETLLQSKNFRLERIVSHGQTSPDNFWYDQDHPEWVILLSGSARLLFADQNQEIELYPGDYLSIPAHRKHRISWTDPGKPSVWLAIHY